MRFLWALLALLLPLALSANPLLNQEDPVIGKINGSTVRLSEIEDKEINDLRVQLHEALQEKFKRKALTELAQKDKAFQNRPSLEVSDRAARRFYQENGLKARGSFEQLKGQIVQYLMQQKLIEHFDELYAKAERKKKIQFYPSQPEVFKVSVPLGSAYLWGDPKQASVMFLEFSDYQCPFCGRVQDSLGELRRQYKGQVAFGYRHFPLQFHEQADEAAIAAECARDQGKFEAFHKTLYDNPKKQHPQDLLRYAGLVGVPDKGRFERCLNEEKYRDRVNLDMREAASVGVRGTPSFVVGRYDPKTGEVTGELFSGALPKAKLAAVIEKYRKK